LQVYSKLHQTVNSNLGCTRGAPGDQGPKKCLTGSRRLLKFNQQLNSRVTGVDGSRKKHGECQTDIVTVLSFFGGTPEKS